MLNLQKEEGCSVETVEVYYDPRGIMGNGPGCWRAHVVGNYCISGFGDTEEEALSNLLSFAERIGESSKLSEYNIVKIPTPH